jgi:hypothetical protein
MMVCNNMMIMSCHHPINDLDPALLAAVLSDMYGTVMLQLPSFYARIKKHSPCA